MVLKEPQVLVGVFNFIPHDPNGSQECTDVSTYLSDPLGLNRAKDHYKRQVVRA